MAFNFVKFQRGSAQAYQNLQNNGGLEPDALYFIYDKTAPENGGSLYLGNVLIGGSNLNTSITSLNDLSDVDTNDVTMMDGMILQYNINTGKYSPISIKTAIEESGANISNGNNNITLPIVESITTQNENENAIEILNSNYTSPTEGDIIFVNNTPYVYDGTHWQELIGQNIEDRISILEQGLSAVQQTLINSDHLSYIVENSLPTISQSNVNDFKNKVILVPNANASGNDQYDEYMLIQKNEEYTLEKLGSWNVDLDNYVQTGDLNNYVTSSELSRLSATIGDTYLTINRYENEVGDINTLRQKTNNNSSTIIGELTNIYDRLKWTEL